MFCTLRANNVFAMSGNGVGYVLAITYFTFCLVDMLFVYRTNKINT